MSGLIEERPRLHWMERPPTDAWMAVAPPLLLPVERHAEAQPPLLGPADAEVGGRLVLGDNLAVGRALLPELRGAVNLIYMDPPFGTGGRFLVRRQPGTEGAHTYSDAWEGGLRGYLDMLLPRLELAHALLSPTGSLYVHLDPTAAHYVKVLLDEIFGPECFQREIVWRIGWVSGYKGTVRNWVRNHDTILFYTRDPDRFTFNKTYVPHLPGYQRRGGGEGPGHPIDDVWNGSPAEHALTGADALDSIQIKSFSAEKTGYETQKNESLLRRVVESSSDPGHLVVDLFAGSGTTLAVAEKLGRRWLGCDLNPTAIHVARGRLLTLPERRAFEVLAVAPEVPEPLPAGDALEMTTVGAEVRLALRQPDEVDYWAVQWEAEAGDEAPLRPDFRSFRQYSIKRENTLQPQVTHRYARPGVYALAAHVAGPDGRLRRIRREVVV